MMMLKFEMFLILAIKYYEKKAHQYDDRQRTVKHWVNEKKQELENRRKYIKRNTCINKESLFTSIYRDQHPLLIDLKEKQMIADFDIRSNGFLFENNIYVQRVSVLIDIPVLNSCLSEERMLENRFHAYIRKATQMKEILEKRKTNCYRFNYIERYIMSFLYPFTARIM